ncbi:restriction endonuclease subunit S [Pseudoalteromonas rhizosphaerae]|uniref:restriction endonuclease subunit S n=1 Tax=Pseudoalteromonas rhizosphaerae TaxID=2518973 RepID=UPI0012306E05|nr:restriction endonuclease subunit S [Pseudoalteromonas rhizosphaerae]
MSIDWPIQTLGDVCEKITDGAHNSPKSVTCGKHMASVKDLTHFGVDLSQARLIAIEEFDKLVKQGCRPEVGDVLIAKDGNSALDTVCTVDTPLDAVMLSSVAILRPDKLKLDFDFLKYYFCSKEVIDYLKGNFISGAAIPRVVLKDFRKAKIKLPPLVTQRKIAQRLRLLDEKILLNRQTNQTLEQIAQAMFKSWFVDFDPVRAKIAANAAGENAQRAAMAAISGLSITPEQAQGLAAGAIADIDQLQQQHPEQYQQLQATADLFPDNLIDSELGEIPDGWVWSEIGNEVDVVGGGTPSTKNADFWDGGDIFWTTPKDMSNLTDKILLETDRKITSAGLKKISSGLLPVNTVLMSSRAPVGYLAITKVPLAINQGYIAMKCEATLTPEYVVQWAESVMDEVKQRASGTTFAEISKKNFKIIAVIVPEDKVLAEFTSVVSSLYEKVTETLIETKSLTAIRDTLLPRLLSGELSIDTSETEF